MRTILRAATLSALALGMMLWASPTQAVTSHAVSRAVVAKQKPNKCKKHPKHCSPYPPPPPPTCNVHPDAGTPGQTVRFGGTHWQPGTTVNVTLEGTPFGHGTVNGKGHLHGTGTVPAESPTSVTADPNAPAIPTTTGTPLPEKPSEPGVDCRTVR